MTRKNVIWAVVLAVVILSLGVVGAYAIGSNQFFSKSAHVSVSVSIPTPSPTPTPTPTPSVPVLDGNVSSDYDLNNNPSLPNQTVVNFTNTSGYPVQVVVSQNGTASGESLATIGTQTITVPAGGSNSLQIIGNIPTQGLSPGTHTADIPILIVGTY